MTSTLGRFQPRSVALLPRTPQAIPEAIDTNLALERTRTRSRIMAVVKEDGSGHDAITVHRPRSPPAQHGSGRQLSQWP